MEDLNLFFASPKSTQKKSLSNTIKTPSINQIKSRNGVTPRSPSRLQQVTNRANTEEIEDEEEDDDNNQVQEDLYGEDFGGGGEEEEDEEEDMQVDDGE